MKPGPKQKHTCRVGAPGGSAHVEPRLIAVIAAWAFVFSYALRWLERVLVPWKGKA